MVEHAQLVPRQPKSEVLIYTTYYRSCRFKFTPSPSSLQTMSLFALAYISWFIALSSLPSYAAYNLVRDHSGSNFFSGWDYYGTYDNLTNGGIKCTTLNPHVVVTQHLLSRCQLFGSSRRDVTESSICHLTGYGYHQSRQLNKRAVQ